jgi:glycosyltransferase involved in cell wall biosynthesis
MEDVMRQSHIVCLPSYYREGLPKALIEAASSGRPIVTTNTPGCRDVVRHGENGFLVPPRNVPALAAALRTLLDDANLRQEMGRHGRSHAETQFSIESIVNQHLNVYRELLSRAA